MLFHKKKSQPVPPEEVQKLVSSGMSDKDTIKHLKSKGYGYEEIEKAMMSAVKRGVEAPQFAPSQPGAPLPKRDLPELPEIQDYRPEEDIMGGLQETEPDLSPDIIVEEIVEGVVEEKWQKFEERIRKTENDFTNLSIQLKQFQQPRQDQPVKDYDPKIAEINEQMEDLQARVGGLEKAFRQFLPSLTRNIESLAGLIHEMKEKQSVQQKEFA